jgi:Ca2+-transporting ATPase
MSGSEQYAGLTETEVTQNRQKFGTNRLVESGNNRFFHVLREVVLEPLFILLVLTSLIYFLLGENNEGIIMLIALSFVSGISIFQETRSRNAVDELNKISAPLAKVIRGENLIRISSDEIVLNDLIVVEDGDLIPADAVILRMNDFSVNESVLTGESLPVFKVTSPEMQYIYRGTHVVSGACTARVTAVGKSTRFGKIGESLLEIGSSKTPLQLQIKNFIRSMVSAGLVAFVIVWAVNYYISKDIIYGLLRGLTLAMSILPEEIPVAFSTFMALGAYHLYKKKVIARSPHTVETLGASTVICVDKTGTITENRMELAVIYDFISDLYVDYTLGDNTYTPVLAYSMWASESQPFDAMEISIHEKYGKTAPLDLRPEYQMVKEYPLGGTPPIMTHVFSNSAGHIIIACKGSLETVLRLSKLADPDKTEIQKKAGQLASKGYRVLGVGRSEMKVNELPESQLDIQLEFMGLVAFYDPPKKNMPAILRQFYDAGIQVKMLTGDYTETALAIAKEINFRTGKATLNGDQITKLSDDELRRVVHDTHLYTRMFPEVKLRVIEALKSNGEVVAMTGDGVNDAPALKASHIGIAMGKRGSEVARNAASLILMDDDLGHMPDAVALGRRIYENLKKAIRYIISIHIPIILIVTMPLVLGWAFHDIFSPIHVIILELIMGPTCSIIYENEPMEEYYMKKAPRKINSDFFSFRELSISIIQGIVITIACLTTGYYYLADNSSETLVRTVIYTTLIFSNLFLTLTNRSFFYSIFTTLTYKNKLIPLIISISLAILLLSIYYEPVQEIFRFEALSLKDLTRCFISAFTGVLWIEIYKFFRRKRQSLSKE